MRELVERLDRDAQSLAQREQELAGEAEAVRSHLARIEGQLSEVAGEGRPIARVAERVEGLAARLPGTRSSRRDRSGARPV